jgi:hypothetical protein
MFTKDSEAVVEQWANREFENVGDEGMSPNHSDKDIWVNGFKSAFQFMFQRLSLEMPPIHDKKWEKIPLSK